MDVPPRLPGRPCAGRLPGARTGAVPMMRASRSPARTPQRRHMRWGRGRVALWREASGARPAGARGAGSRGACAAGGAAASGTPDVWWPLDGEQGYPQMPQVVRLQRAWARTREWAHGCTRLRAARWPASPHACMHAPCGLPRRPRLQQRRSSGARVRPVQTARRPPRGGAAATQHAAGSARTSPVVGDADLCAKMLAQGGYPQPSGMPAGYPPYPYPMMGAYAPAPVATGKGKAAAGEPTAKGRKRRKRIPQGGPKKPATSFVLFSNTVRERVKEENPGLSFLDLGKKLGEMWREMDPTVGFPSSPCTSPLPRGSLSRRQRLPTSCRISRRIDQPPSPRPAAADRGLPALRYWPCLCPAPCLRHVCRCAKSTRTGRTRPRSATWRRRRSGWRSAPQA